MRRPASARSARGPAGPDLTRWIHLVVDSGYSLIELLFALSLTATLGGAALPQLVSTMDDDRALGAVRFLATRLQETRMEAIMRSVDIGFQFVQTDGGYVYAAYVDGNGNGIRSADIAQGVESRLLAQEHLSDRFPGVDFGVLPGLPGVEGDATPPGTDPIKLGTSKILTFTPSGTSSSGSLYVRGKRDRQFVLRISGDTAKIRVLRYDARDRHWKAL